MLAMPNTLVADQANPGSTRTSGELFALKMLMIAVVSALPASQAKAARETFEKQMEPAMEAMRDQMGYEFMGGCYAVMDLFREKPKRL